MLDVAIVGGGLAGLALAHSLHARRVDWALFEARHRLGGRVLTVKTASGAALDLGPTWFWPDTQPSMARLVHDLGLDSIAQPDDGRVWLLDDASGPPRALPFDGTRGTLAGETAPATPGALHGGARRVAGGMAQVTDALAAALPPACVHAQHQLQAIDDAGDHVQLHLTTADGPQLLRARRVVLALPPRLVAEHVRCTPALPDDLLHVLRSTPTWMASAAKAAASVAHTPWRDDGLAGNAWVTHAQATLAEVFEMGDDAHPALGGFVALGVAERGPFARALPLLVESQLCMLFGPRAMATDVQLQDWADEPQTCSTLDRQDDGRQHPAYGHPGLQQGAWGDKLWFGGSETAGRGGGYLEGALVSAARLRRQLVAAGTG